MQSTTEAMWLALSGMGSSTGRIWTGWTTCGLTAAFMLFDAGGKFAKPKPADPSGFDGRYHSAGVYGTLSRFCYLSVGCDFAYRVSGRRGSHESAARKSLLTHTLFPVYVGVLSWVGLWLREPRIEAVFPLLR
jgi:hypothetical protein